MRFHLDWRPWGRGRLGPSKPSARSPTWSHPRSPRRLWRGPCLGGGGGFSWLGPTSRPRASRKRWPARDGLRNGSTRTGPASRRGFRTMPPLPCATALWMPSPSPAPPPWKGSWRWLAAWTRPGLGFPMPCASDRSQPPRLAGPGSGWWRWPGHIQSMGWWRPWRPPPAHAGVAPQGGSGDRREGGQRVRALRGPRAQRP